jgi:branched-chain amino acid transport system permease protein
MSAPQNGFYTRKKPLIWLAVAVVGIFALSAPLYTSPFMLRVLQMFFFSVGLALSWNILGGYAGYWSFGHTVFIGIGAFVAGKLALVLGPHTNNILLFLLSLAAGGLASCLLALLLSYPLLRLRGIYFAIAMLGVAELGAELASNVDAIGGGMGLMLPVISPADMEPAVFFYYLFLIAVIVVIIVAAWIKYSKFGYGLISIREDEDTAKMLGVPTEKYKTLSFLISSSLVGVLGVVYGYYLGYFTTASVIRVDFSLNMILHALIGGIGTLIGPIIGAAVMVTLTKVVLGRLLDIHILITGILVITIVLLVPSGFIGTFKNMIARRTAMAVEAGDQKEDVSSQEVNTEK